MASKVKRFTIIFLAIAISFLIGCDLKLKQAVANYKGNGQIIYLKGPLLGTSGVSIKMPSFNLAKEFNLEYQLAGIPRGNQYIVYLVVPDPCPINQVLQGSFKLEIYKDNFLVDRLTASSLEEMTNSVGGGENRFYFYGRSQFDVIEEAADWSLKATGNNEKLTSSVKAFILVRRGGYK